MYVRVHVTPGARKERVTKVDERTFQITVREPAARNLANSRVREVLARELGVTSAQVVLLTGHRSSTKMYSIEA